MKKTTTFVMAGVIVAVLSAGDAVAAPIHGGHHGSQPSHVVTHVQSSPRSGHHHVVQNGGHHHAPQHYHQHHHAHHYYRTSSGDWVIATAILLSALI